MSKQVTLQINLNPKGTILAKGKYNVKIYAVDSYGKVSSNFTSIDNVEIQ